MTAAELAQAHWESRQGKHLEMKCPHLLDQAAQLPNWNLALFERADGSGKRLYYFCCSDCERMMR